jgi:hypothetical protein
VAYGQEYPKVSLAPENIGKIATRPYSIIPWYAIAGKDYATGEVIAIFDQDTAKKEYDVSELGSIREEIRGEFRVRNQLINVTTIPLPNVSSQNNASRYSQVCGKTLLVLKFSSSVPVEEVIESFRAYVLSTGKKLKYINPNTTYGIGPEGYGIPASNSMPDSYIRNSTAVTSMSGMNVTVLDTYGGGADPFNPTNLYGSGQRGHGIWVSNIIKNAVGVSPTADAVCDKDGKCSDSKVVQGLCTALSNEASIINMSFGSIIDSETLRLAVSDVIRAGSLVVAAVGNTRDPELLKKRGNLYDKQLFPASYSWGSQPGMKRFSSGDTYLQSLVVSVGAVSPTGDFAAYATQRPIDFVADEFFQYKASSLPTSYSPGQRGTSYAAPRVTAAAAKILAKGPRKPSDLIMELLKYADVNKCRRGDCGAGYIIPK